MMLKIFCRKHPKWDAKAEPKTCENCWWLWDLLHDVDATEVIVKRLDNWD